MWKIVLAVILLAAAGLGGFYLGKGEREIQIVEKKGETITVTKERIVTRIRTVRPDGTVTEETREEERDKSVNEKVTSTDTKTSPVLSKYSLGIHYWVSGLSDVVRGPSSNNLSINVGRRLLGEVWADVEVRPLGEQRGVAVGVSFKF